MGGPLWRGSRSIDGEKRARRKEARGWAGKTSANPEQIDEGGAGERLVVEMGHG